MKRLIRSIGFALRGLLEGFRSERNVKIHFGAMVMVIIFGIWFRIDAWEWAAVLLCTALVISMELVNTGIEAVMDHLHPEIHDRVRLIKNISAGAVLVAAIISLVIGMIIFLPRIWALISGISSP